jgi:hypothetical protein
MKKIAIKYLFCKNIATHRPSLRTSKLHLHEKPSALKEHPELQNMKFIDRFLFFWAILPSWTHIHNKDFNIRNHGRNCRPSTSKPTHDHSFKNLLS